MPDKDKTSISWLFPEFEKHQRSKLWWTIFIIIDIIIFLYAILSANFLFALIIIMITGIIVFRHYHEPEEIEFKITGDGLTVGNKAFRWSELEKFWFVYEPPEVKNLYIAFKSKIRSHLTIPLGRQNPLQVRKILSNYLAEDLEREEEPTAEALGRLLKI